MDDQSNTDLLLQQQLQEQQQRQRALHHHPAPSPSPIPYPYYPSSSSSSTNHQSSDRLRRRNTNSGSSSYNNYQNHSEDNSVGSLNDSQSSFRAFNTGLDGLEMPSTNYYMESHNHNPHNSDHLLPNNGRHTNGPTNAAYNYPRQQQQQQQQRMHRSLNSISHSPTATTTHHHQQQQHQYHMAPSPARHPQHHHQQQQQYQPSISVQRTSTVPARSGNYNQYQHQHQHRSNNNQHQQHTHQNPRFAVSGHDSSSSVGSAHSSHNHNNNNSRRRRTGGLNLVPQHQLDRKNSRRTNTTNNYTNRTTTTSHTHHPTSPARRSTTATTARRNTNNSTTPPPSNSTRTTGTASKNKKVPNRYYIPQNKSVQAEWSSPTRQRRSRNTLGGGSTNTSDNSNSSAKRIQKSKSGDLEDGHNNHHHHARFGRNHSGSNHSNGSGNSGHHIIVLPSISIPNGGNANHGSNSMNGDVHDPYASYRLSSQTKPPALPLRRPCVQMTSTLFCCNMNFNTFKWCMLLQIMIVIPLCLYVFDAHSQKRHAKQQLQAYNEEHDQILTNMMWMDQKTKQMEQFSSQYHRDKTGQHHDNFDVLPRAASSTQQQGVMDSYYYADNDATEDLRDSVHKLRGQMRDMQYRIQQNSIIRIAEKYGEGPIQVYINPEPLVDELDTTPRTTAGNGGDIYGPDSYDEEAEQTSEIAIELFIQDTPHAVSTFLYQIERGHWNRVQMNWISDTSMMSKPGSSVTSSMGDWGQTSRLEFLETFPIRHCEVSLVQRGQNQVLSLKINLVEVPFSEHEEVCIGRLLNDRLILPKSREYFMAKFSTTSSAGTNLHQQQQQLQLPQDEEETAHEKHHDPPALPPAPQYVYEDEEERQHEQQQQQQEAEQDAGTTKEEDVDVEDEDGGNSAPGGGGGQQVVPPLHEPPRKD